jgi:ArsR family transcriptional regulator, arsenate/arsenite/antimonite-responsive transcriptional repressor
VKREIAVIEECCAPLTKSPLAPGEADLLAGALRVMADPARLRIVSLLAHAADAEACVCELTAPLGLSQPTVSHHLKVLREAGLLAREQRGRWVFYRLVPGPLATLAEAITAAGVPVPA